jgi:hypothetical protein
MKRRLLLINQIESNQIKSTNHIVRSFHSSIHPFIHSSIHSFIYQSKLCLNSSSRYGAVAEHLGSRGAPSFILRGAVAELEAVAHRYLRHLSEGSLALRLRLDTATGDRVTKRVLVRAAGGKSKIKSNG